MARTPWLWLVCTVATAAVLSLLAWCCGPERAWEFMGIGVGVSLVTVVASQVTLAMSGAAPRPLHRMLLETSVRTALPLGFLLAIRIARRELLGNTFLLYFLPFQFVTIVVSVLVSVGRIKASAADASGRSGSDA